MCSIWKFREVGQILLCWAVSRHVQILEFMGSGQQVHFTEPYVTGFNSDDGFSVAKVHFDELHFCTGRGSQLELPIAGAIYMQIDAWMSVGTQQDCKGCFKLPENFEFMNGRLTNFYCSFVRRLEILGSTISTTHTAFCLPAGHVCNPQFEVHFPFYFWCPLLVETTRAKRTLFTLTQYCF